MEVADAGPAPDWGKDGISALLVVDAVTGDDVEVAVHSGETLKNVLRIFQTID